MSDKVYKPLQPYSEEVAAQIVHPPAPPKQIGYEPICIAVSLVKTGGIYSDSGSYTVPNDKILYVTDISISHYIDNWTAGTQGHGYARITTNDTISYIAQCWVRGGRENGTTGDSADNVTANFPFPLRIASNKIVTFLGLKSSNHASSIFYSHFILHGFLVNKN